MATYYNYNHNSTSDATYSGWEQDKYWSEFANIKIDLNSMWKTLEPLNIIEEKKQTIYYFDPENLDLEGI